MGNEHGLPLCILSDTAAVVSGIHVARGDQVTSNQLLVTTELMKMRHEIRAPASGVVEDIRVSEGDVVQAGTALLSLTRVAQTERDDRTEDVREASTRPSLSQMQARHARIADSARPEAVAKRHALGLRTARENLADLLDEGSFLEYGALALAAQRQRHRAGDLQEKTPADGIVTGFGTVNAGQFGAERAACAVMAVDYTVLAGTQGYFHHKKIDRLLSVVSERPVPVIVFPEGGGGRPNDSDIADISFSGLDVQTFWRFAQLSGRAPRIAVVAGRCFAGNAAFAACADVVIATRRSNIGMGGPAMIEGGGLGTFLPEDVGPAEELHSSGVVDILVEDEAEGVAAAKQYLSYLQGPLDVHEAEDPMRLREAVPEDRSLAYDMRRVVRTLADRGSVLELRGGFGAGMITALIRISGRPFGLIANNPRHLGGAIDPDAAEKASRFLQSCETFGLPVISLCDTPGFMVGPATERAGQVRSSGQLFTAGASLTVPLFTIVLRKGYGLGAQAMAGGSFHRPMFTAAWPTAEVGAMGLEGAVRLGARAELAAITDERTRERVFRRLVGRAYERGKAINAASLCEFDAVIDPADTRRWILSGLASGGGQGARPERVPVTRW